MGWRKFAGALALLCAVTGCTSTVTGVPSAAPGAKAVAPPKDPNDPCGLLTPEQLAGMDLLPDGHLYPAEPQRTLPAHCGWNMAEEEEGNSSARDSLTVMYSTAIPIEDYHNSKAPIEQMQAGGFTWGRYESLLGPSSCDLAVKLGPMSFVEVGSENDADFSKACDRAKLALPQVAAHLPGGQPAPPLTPKPKPPPSPLAALEPCDLLTAAELPPLHLTGAGRKVGKDRDPTDTIGHLPPGCEWDPTDENVHGCSVCTSTTSRRPSSMPLPGRSPTSRSNREIAPGSSI